MNLYYLTVELIIDTIAFALGTILIFRKSDNLPQFYWGIIAALIGLVFIWENIGWVVMRTQNPIYEYTDILNIEKMVKFYMLASIVSLYPLASLRPGYLTHFRVTLHLIPPIVVTTIGTCYLYFNGNITLLDSIHQIGDYIHRFDIQLRLAIFACTILTPLIYFLYPLLGSNLNLKRRTNRTLYIFLFFIFALLAIYLLFTLFICDIFFNGFGIVSISFSIFFSVQYLYKENPLSDHIEASTITNHTWQESIATATNVQPVILPLFKYVDNYLKENRDYTHSTFTLEHLSKAIRKDESDISHAIKNAGYSGFKEYINQLRLAYFRYLVSQNPNLTTKELWVECGFTSKATFYRIFSSVYHEAPREYIEKQKGSSDLIAK